MPRMKIIDAKIKMISLCRRGKNHMPVIYKSDGDNGLELLPMLKASDSFDEKGELLVVVYPPNLPDSDDHFSDAAGIKSMVHSFAKSGLGLDIEHDGKVLSRDDAYVAESFIIQKGDPRYANWKDTNGKTVDVTGGWGAVFQIENPALRKLYRDGSWNGVSLFGRGVMEQVSKSENTVERFLDTLLKKLGVRNEPNTEAGDDEMKPDEMEALFEKNNKNLAAAIVEGLVKALKPSDAKPEETKPAVDPAKAKDAEIAASVEFVGDISKAEDVEAHAKKVALEIAKSKVDWTDPKSIKAYTDAIAKSKPAPAASGGASNQPAAVEPDPTARHDAALVKSIVGFANA